MGSKRQHLVLLVFSAPRVELRSTFFWQPTVDERVNRKTSGWLGRMFSAVTKKAELLLLQNELFVFSSFNITLDDHSLL